MLARFGLLVWPETGGTWKNVDRIPDGPAKAAAFGAFDQLDALDPLARGAELDAEDAPPFLRFDPEALEAFTDWRCCFEAGLRSGDLYPALESHLAKYRKLVPALALVFHLTNGHHGPVRFASTLRALHWSAISKPTPGAVMGSLSTPKRTRHGGYWRGSGRGIWGARGSVAVTCGGRLGLGWPIRSAWPRASGCWWSWGTWRSGRSLHARNRGSCTWSIRSRCRPCLHGTEAEYCPCAPEAELPKLSFLNLAVLTVTIRGGFLGFSSWQDCGGTVGTSRACVCYTL